MMISEMTEVRRGVQETGILYLKMLIEVSFLA